jgi:hypothetical protein
LLTAIAIATPTREDAAEIAGDCAAVGTTDGPAAGVANAATFAVVAADYRIGTGWIDTNLPSQIIRFGAYRHDVKNRDSWPGVILVFGRMS